MNIDRFRMPASSGIVLAARRCSALLCLLALAACTAPRTLLNSERIEHQYGSYTVRVLDSRGDLRVSSLQSGDAVTRTLAVVMFENAAGRPYAELHRRILGGASIGSTMQAAGWHIEKPRILLGTLDVPTTAAAVGELMRVSLPVTLAMHAYRFDIERDGQGFAYATIVELHHPDYLAFADLQELYGSGPALPADADRDRRLTARVRTVIGALERAD